MRCCDGRDRVRNADHTSTVRLATGEWQAPRTLSQKPTRRFRQGNKKKRTKGLNDAMRRQRDVDVEVDDTLAEVDADALVPDGWLPCYGNNNAVIDEITSSLSSPSIAVYYRSSAVVAPTSF